MSLVEILRFLVLLAAFNSLPVGHQPPVRPHPTAPHPTTPQPYDVNQDPDLGSSH